VRRPAARVGFGHRAIGTERFGARFDDHRLTISSGDTGHAGFGTRGDTETNEKRTSGPKGRMILRGLFTG
jgi:hypothetical protein